MLGDYQKFEVTVKFTYDGEVFPEDPDDVYELAELEKEAVKSLLHATFAEFEVTELEIAPIIGE